jgi:L-rhamnose mutarotase
MGQFFEALDVPPDQGLVLLEEVFHLEDQLATPDTTTIED